MLLGVLLSNVVANEPWPELTDVADPRPLPGSALLTLRGDIASNVVDGVHRFLDRKIVEVNQARSTRPPLIDLEALAKMLGCSGVQSGSTSMEHYTDETGIIALAEHERYRVYTVRWTVYEGVEGEGLLFVPVEDIRADLVYVPDAGEWPAWLEGGRLASAGIRVLMPMLIDRNPSGYRMSRRDWLYRPAFELGRHLIGYEVDKICGAAQCLRNTAPSQRPMGLIGEGEGGLMALYSAPFQEAFSQVMISGYFGLGRTSFQAPAYRTLFGKLNAFGDAEVAAMLGQRHLLLHHGHYPELVVPSGSNAKPGVLRAVSDQEFETEWKRLHAIASGLKIERVDTEPLDALYQGLTGNSLPKTGNEPLSFLRNRPQVEAVQKKQVAQIDRYNQRLLRKSAREREEFGPGWNFDSIETFEESAEWYRKHFREQVIGTFDEALVPAMPRTRLVKTAEGVDMYEVVLNVYPELIAYGWLLVPQDIAVGERRPVVVCQHGLEGRPQDVVGKEKYHAYKAFATRLAQEGFVTFAPQNLYILKDRFRQLQFKANSIGKTLFSVMTSQHQQMLDWLQTLRFVDGGRIGFYGLSYGGKSAMRIPPLVPDYKAVICSADFNEWIWKNASSKAKYSYAQLGEYEIFEWNLGQTFNYSDMAALIAPRPFMVERGHYDGVAPDEKVAHEYARVRRMYARLGIADRTDIEWFNGPHTINGKGTFEFLRRHLGPVRQNP